MFEEIFSDAVRTLLIFLWAVPALVAVSGAICAHFVRKMNWRLNTSETTWKRRKVEKAHIDLHFFGMEPSPQRLGRPCSPQALSCAKKGLDTQRLLNTVALEPQGGHDRFTQMLLLSNVQETSAETHKFGPPILKVRPGGSSAWQSFRASVGQMI